MYTRWEQKSLLAKRGDGSKNTVRAVMQEICERHMYLLTCHRITWSGYRFDHRRNRPKSSEKFFTDVRTTPKTEGVIQEYEATKKHVLRIDTHATSQNPIRAVILIVQADLRRTIVKKDYPHGRGFVQCKTT